MNRIRIHHGLALALSAALALGTAPRTLAAGDQSTAAPVETGQAARERSNRAAEAEARRQAPEVVDAAAAAVAETVAAVAALRPAEKDAKPDLKAARTHVDRALDKLAALGEEGKRPALVPVEVTSQVEDVPLSAAEIRAARAQALQLLADRQLQLARPIIASLASEVRLTTTYVAPERLAVSLRAARALLEAGAAEDARLLLADALAALPSVETVVPLPVLRAELLIGQARELAAKKERSEEEAARLAALLDRIGAEIARGRALEYGSAAEFDRLEAELADLRRRLAAGESGAGLLDRIEGMFRALGERHQAERNLERARP